MSGTGRQVKRCAIYTRVSTEYGLEQEFNSLDAQREACEAYVKSQAHEGWMPIAEVFDDGGYSGGSVDRPAVQRLLAAVRHARIDIVVVYKVDRLTRSLADFAKLVELFDQHGVSFVSVTQSFNTTSSMGRLTLNVLLSFAQFEREVTAERIRDKIAASKRKGIRVGGPVPLGYRVADKKLIVDEAEAATVRTISELYCDLGSLSAVAAELDARAIVTKRTQLKSGEVRGGIGFTKSPLQYLLRNRVYVGELVHKGRHYPGEHVAIVDRTVFDAVQAKLAEQAPSTGREPFGPPAMLKGRIFDDRGNRMTPSLTTKGGARYRYYVSHPLVQGRRAEAGSLPRVPAADLEEAVVDAVRARLTACQSGSGEAEQIAAQLDRVIVRAGEVEVRFHAEALLPGAVLRIPWMPPPSRSRREVIRPPGSDPAPDTRPIRSESRARLVEAIAKARRWLDDLVAGRVSSTREIADLEGCSERSVRQRLNLAFLSPDLVRAAVAGTIPHGIGVTRLTELPLDWGEQCETATGRCDADWLRKAG